MAITINGVKVVSVDITRDEDGNPKVKGNHHLISSTGTVIAKQSFNGYNDITLQPSAQTSKLLHELMVSITSDVNATLGLA